MSWDFLRVPLPFPERKVHQPGVNVDVGPSGVIQGAPQLPDPILALLWPWESRGCLGSQAVGFREEKRRGKAASQPCTARMEPESL